MKILFGMILLLLFAAQAVADVFFLDAEKVLTSGGEDVRVRLRDTPPYSVVVDAQSPKGLFVYLSQGGRAQKQKIVSEVPHISIY